MIRSRECRIHWEPKSGAVMAMRKQVVGGDDSTDPETTIERAFEFVRDVLDDPAVLDKLPERATLMITPIENRDSQTRYSATTRRFAIAAVEVAPDGWRPSF